jgi:hypothetical protein
MAEKSFTVVTGNTDGGGYQITFVNGKVVVKKIPPWNPDAVAELNAAIQVMKAAGRFKTPELTEAAASSIARIAQNELGAQAAGNTVLAMA